MKKSIGVSVYHDCRRALKNDTYPVAIVVNFPVTKGGVTKWKQSFFATGVHLSKLNFTKVMDGSGRGELKEIRSVITKAENKAKDIIKYSPNITREVFAVRYAGKYTSSTDLELLYNELIETFNARNQISTAATYLNSLRSLKAFRGDGILLTDIDKAFLKDYEAWMISKNKSVSTIGFYLRPLRAVFNIAIEDKRIISREFYPFGPREYIIPSSNNYKTSLGSDEKDKLVDYTSKNDRYMKALDFWKFSYYCNGMNFADMAYLKEENIVGETLFYYRRKTSSTKRDQSPIMVHLRAECLDIIKRRGTHRPFLFGIITPDQSKSVQKSKIKKWLWRTNFYLKLISESLGIKRVMPKHARHTAATMVLRAGTDIHTIKDMLGHSSIQTTQNYIKSLGGDALKKISESL